MLWQTAQPSGASQYTRIRFAQDNVKDVSDYLATHSIRELWDKIGEWFIQPEPEPVVEA